MNKKQALRAIFLDKCAFFSGSPHGDSDQVLQAPVEFGHRVEEARVPAC